MTDRTAVGVQRVGGSAVDWDRRAELFSLDPRVAYLNHGSYGAVPKPVQAAQQRLRDEMDANPMAFFSRGLLDRVAHTRRHLAGFVGADPDGVALVANATTGTAIVLGSLELRAGDEILLTNHGYGAVRMAAEAVAAPAGASVREVALPLAGPDDEVLEIVTGAVRPGRTRLVVIDHVTSPTARLMPVNQLVDALHERGVMVLVDAAHAPGMLDLQVARLGADFWLGNLHKWAFAPRPTALLAVAAEHRPTMRPRVVSWEHHMGYPAAQEFAGTLDYTPWLAAPAGVHLLRTLGLDRVRGHNNGLATQGQRLVAAAIAPHWPRTDAAALAELETAREGRLGHPQLSLRLVPLPPAVADDRAALQHQLATAHRIEVPVVAWGGRAYVRLSAQVYNRIEDYDRLAHALARELAA